MTNIFPDVLICAYNEAPHIPRALESLRLQSVGPEKFRVIFVDNASTDDTPKVVRENAHGLNLKYVYEPHLGIISAWKTGYQHAQAPYVAHLDADAKADPHWLENIMRVIQQEQPDLCGGPYFPYYITPKPAWFLDRYNSNYMGEAPHCLQEREFLSGTNMVWRRSMIEQLGGFKLGVGLRGRGVARDDETKLIVRARKEIPNFKAFYHPGIIVYHLTRPERFSLWYWVRRNFTQGRFSHEIWGASRQSYSTCQAVIHFFLFIIKVVAKTALAFVRRDKNAYPYWQNYWHERMLPHIYWLGVLWHILNQKGRVLRSGKQKT
jgi:glycosyltransferase involved in cell wall biosynthesis